MLGIAALLLGGLPVWLTNRQILEGTWSDRFTLAPMLGAAVLLVAVDAPDGANVDAAVVAAVVEADAQAAPATASARTRIRAISFFMRMSLLLFHFCSFTEASALSLSSRRQGMTRRSSQLVS